MAKSKFGGPDASEKSETRTAAVSGNRVTMHWNFAAGNGEPCTTVGNF